MGRYIDVDKAKEVFHHKTGGSSFDSFIDDVPTADVVTVRHGRWKSEMRERCDWKGKKQNYYQPNSCSVCHEAVVERTPYCPYCGADMRGRRDT